MQKYSRDVRLQHLEAWKQQGISGSEYCKIHGIKPTTFYSWIKIEKKLASQDAGELPGFVAIHPNAESQLQMMQSEIVIRKGAISISIPGGVNTGLKLQIFTEVKLHTPVTVLECMSSGGTSILEITQHSFCKLPS